MRRLGAQRGLPYLTVVRDFDDANVLTTLAAYAQYDPCYVKRLDQPLIKFSIVPHIAMAAYSGAFTSYANRQKQWIDVASADVIHYGYKYAVTPPSTATPPTPSASSACGTASPSSAGRYAEQLPGQKCKQVCPSVFGGSYK